MILCSKRLYMYVFLYNYVPCRAKTLQVYLLPHLYFATYVFLYLTTYFELHM